MQAITRPIAAATGITVDQAASLTVLRYAGQEFRMQDYSIGSAGIRRVSTMLPYPNDGYGGGETVSPIMT